VKENLEGVRVAQEVLNLTLYSEPGAVATGSPLTKETCFLNQVFTQPHPVATASGSDIGVNDLVCAKSL
jgi:hypothetical protein